MFGSCRFSALRWQWYVICFSISSIVYRRKSKFPFLYFAMVCFCIIFSNEHIGVYPKFIAYFWILPNVLLRCNQRYSFSWSPFALFLDRLVFSRVISTIRINIDILRAFNIYHFHLSFTFSIIFPSGISGVSVMRFGGKSLVPYCAWVLINVYIRISRFLARLVFYLCSFLLFK